jgi:soluble lytic murein transglycosylase-like protein
METPSTFDEIFDAEGNGLPVAFLRALAKRESNNNPSEATGPAWGLLQVGIHKNAGNVLKSYNERFGTDYAKHDMLDPRLNVRVASELLARIVRMYEAEGIKADWDNGNFVGLVVAGWNSGYSKKQGTTRAIRELKALGIPITLAAVYKRAEDNHALTKHLRSPKKQKWQRSVVASFRRESGKSPNPDGEKDGSIEWVPLLLLLLALR